MLLVAKSSFFIWYLCGVWRRRRTEAEAPFLFRRSSRATANDRSVGKSPCQSEIGFRSHLYQLFPTLLLLYSILLQLFYSTFLLIYLGWAAAAFSSMSWPSIPAGWLSTPLLLISLHFQFNQRLSFASIIYFPLFVFDAYRPIDTWHALPSTHNKLTTLLTSS